MPLNQNAERLIRGSLAAVKRGAKVRPVSIGKLTDKQRDDINTHRRQRNFAAISGEIYFRGKHVFESRIKGDGYTEDDVLKQIFSALDADSRFVASQKMTVIENPVVREDGYGNRVKDWAVFECTSRFPEAELMSVIPKGDYIKPGQFPPDNNTPKTKGSHCEAAPLESLTNSPG